MARAGLYKSDIKRARDTLMAAGRHPSLDAVRIALGNTGSKTTIHKYLKELEAEEGIATKEVSLSEQLQDLVARLAERLREEADVRIVAAQAECDTLVKRQADIGRGLEEALANGHAREQDLERQLAAALAHSNDMQKRLQEETIARHTAEQRIADLAERLTENEAHRQSLEDKHSHARNALEHFRQAAKDQRDQDQRRHENQLQHVQSEMRQAQQHLAGKQEELTRLNQEGARLVGELLHARQALTETKQAGDRRETELNGQLTALRVDVSSAQQQLTDARLDAAGQSREIKLLQQELTRMHQLHDQLMEQKITWRHERAQMEEMLRQKEQE